MIYRLVMFITVRAFKMGITIVSLVEALRKRGQKKKDLSTIEYSYYEHEAGQMNVETKRLANNVLQLRKGDRVQNVWVSFTDFDGEGSLIVAGDKALCNDMLSGAGIPVPDYTVLRRGDFLGALTFRKQAGPDIVIKPARDTGDGKGVFIKPKSLFSVWYAANIAGAFGREIVVEKFFPGTNYRLLFCRGEFLGACARIPAHVNGDGSHTILEAITAMNQGRHEQGNYFPYTPESRPLRYRIDVNKSMVKLIKKQGYRLDSVPRRGETVFLQDICHWMKGGEYHDVTEEVPEALVDTCRKAVNTIGVKLAGVDVIAKDIRHPDQATYVINEVNTSPGILIHYEVQNREKMRPVVKDIIRMMFD